MLVGGPKVLDIECISPQQYKNIMKIKVTPGIKGSVDSKKLIKQIKRYLKGKPMTKKDES